VTRLQSERLLLRPWRDADLAPFAALNADAEVMRHFPSTLSTTQSDQFAQRVGKHIVEHGWGLWAVEVRGGSPFVGFVGLARPSFTAHFTPAVEVGWRLARTAWGRGYATEAARAAVDYGFDRLALAEIVSFTTTTNRPSRRVMEKLGMSHDPDDDFDHPSLEEGHPLRRHVLYRLDNPNLPNAKLHSAALVSQTDGAQ
jgi:RimJ/RimL family protein N-acetyltransferase